MFTNVMFYVVWAALAFLFSSVLVLIPQTLKKKILACFLILVVTFGIATLLYKQAEGEQERWNNGICECGGTYELSAASQYRSKDLTSSRNYVIIISERNERANIK